MSTPSRRFPRLRHRDRLRGHLLRPRQYLAARQNATSEERIAALSAEVELLRQRETASADWTRNLPAGRRRTATSRDRPDDGRREPRRNRRRREARADGRDGAAAAHAAARAPESFVELNSYDDRGASNYGTAGYLGNGYFITVKHGVVALGQEGAPDPRKITSIKIMLQGTRRSPRASSTPATRRSKSIRATGRSCE